MSKFKIVAVVSLLALVPILTATKPAPPPVSRGLTGVQEFFTSGIFTVPDGVTHVMVTMWGGGGGGGAAVPQCGPNGGDGRGGGYTNTVVLVTAGSMYKVTVGLGGAGGINQGENGANGTDSQFATLDDTRLAFAGGGGGGTAADPTLGNGTIGAIPQTDSTAQISHGESTTLPYAYTLIPQAPQTDYFGSGGAGGDTCHGNVTPSGRDGKSGYVLLTF